MAKKKGKMPANYGKKYEFWQIEMIFRVKETDTGIKWLAKTFKRTVGAIDFVYRWIEELVKLEPGKELPFPEEAEGGILTHASAVLKMYGTAGRGTIVVE